MQAQGAFIAVNNVVSQSVPHLHVHVVPRNRKDGLRGFFWPRTKYESESHMSDTGAAVRAAVRDLAS
jgi:histidine triad (HIT) family protein